MKYLSGGHIGTIERSLINQDAAGDVFWFTGAPGIRAGEGPHRLRGEKQSQQGPAPSWQGGRMPLSSYMAQVLRHQLHLSPARAASDDPEMKAVQPLLERQREQHRAGDDELLVATFVSKEGRDHVVVYPFEGASLHEAMGSLARLPDDLLKPIAFSIAMNDYGFELLSDQPIPHRGGDR